MAALPFLLSALLLAPLAAPAQVPGNWTLSTAPDLPAIIEQATQPMNFLIRPVARGRLKKTNPAYRTLRIERTSTETVIQFEDRKPQRMPANGQPVAWEREDGEKFQLSGRWEQEDLVQTYRAEDGERSNRFHYDPGTRALQLQVTVSSRKLPAPIHYTLVYKGH